MSDNFAVQTFELTKEFNGLRAVDGIDLTIREGELFSIGSQWCGKDHNDKYALLPSQANKGNSESRRV